MAFREVVDKGKKGIRVEEELTIAYNESPSIAIAARIYKVFDDKFRSMETCQFSIVGSRVSNDGPHARLTGDFLVRKCVGADYPCGETCEIRWDYQACRTEMCRATAITNISSGNIVSDVTTNIKKVSDLSIGLGADATLTADVSQGDIADALSRVGLDTHSLVVAVPNVDFSPFLASIFPPIDVPQEAFVFKPIIDQASWTTLNAAEFPEQAPMAISVKRSQIIERTAACEWLRCRRSPDPDRCRAEL